MRIAVWLIGALLMACGGLSPAWADTGCGPVQAALPAVVSAQASLKQVGDKHEDMNTDIGADERKALQAFKQSLVDGVDARLACAPTSADGAAIEKDLVAALAATPGEKPEANGSATPGFGEALKVGVSASTTQPGLMLVQLNFAIPCGDDNLLLGYRAEDGKWRQVLRWQSADYDSIGDAFGAPFNVLPLASGQIAITHGTPWCTSAWSKFALDLVKPAHATAPQQTVFHLDHTYRLDDDLTLSARPDGFEIRAEVGMLDTDLLMRQGIFRYRVSGDRVERIQPAARNGRDFVDEWLQLEDPLAKAWSEPAHADEAMKARANLMAGNPSLSYGAVRACKGEARHYQVEIALSESGSSRYALLRQEDNGFTLLHLDEKADPACTGPDLMKH